MTSGNFPDPMVLDIHWTLGLLDIAEIVTGSCVFSLSFSIGGSACGMGILLFFLGGLEARRKLMDNSIWSGFDEENDIRSISK